jgi:Tol biopolymer transport system component
VASIVTPFGGSGPPGMDLSLVDLESGDVTPVLARESAAESLDVPVLTPDGAAIVYQRSLVQSVQPTYVTRIERIGVDGGHRTVVIENGRAPALAPDGRSLAYVRVSDVGVELRHLAADGSERAVVPAGRFVAIAYPRFSPDGQQLAFAAITELRSPFRGAPGTSLVGAPLGHGFPYEIWLVGADGQNLIDVPDAINDDRL